jgi:hypothetical protein
MEFRFSGRDFVGYCTIYAIILTLFLLYSCETCGDNVGKESIQIATYLNPDSISIEPDLGFSLIKGVENDLLTTELINVIESSILIKVKGDGITSVLEFDIMQDATLHVTLSDSSNDVCSMINPNSDISWFYKEVNNIRACAYYNIIECP